MCLSTCCCISYHILGNGQSWVNRTLLRLPVSAGKRRKWAPQRQFVSRSTTKAGVHLLHRVLSPATARTPIMYTDDGIKSIMVSRSRHHPCYSFLSAILDVSSGAETQDIARAIYIRQLPLRHFGRKPCMHDACMRLGHGTKKIMVLRRRLCPCYSFPSQFGCKTVRER